MRVKVEKFNLESNFFFWSVLISRRFHYSPLLVVRIAEIDLQCLNFCLRWGLYLNEVTSFLEIKFLYFAGCSSVYLIIF